MSSANVNTASPAEFFENDQLVILGLIYIIVKSDLDKFLTGNVHTLPLKH